MSHTPELEAFYQRRTRYLLRRFFWFWPTVTSVDDVERVTLLGFWVCVALGVLNILTFPFNYARAEGMLEKVFAIADTPLIAAMYYLGANALRRCNLLAATMLTALSFSMAIGFRKLHGYYDYQFTAQACLFSNILRGIYLAAMYKPAPDEGPPLNLISTFGHAIVDRVPSQIWPRFRVAFWILACIQMVISLSTVLPEKIILDLLDTFHITL